jgi:hypothetical protein
MTHDNADYRDDYILSENIIDFQELLDYLIQFFNKMNI